MPVQFNSLMKANNRNVMPAVSNYNCTVHFNLYSKWWLWFKHSNCHIRKLNYSESLNECPLIQWRFHHVQYMWLYINPIVMYGIWLLCQSRYISVKITRQFPFAKGTLYTKSENQQKIIKIKTTTKRWAYHRLPSACQTQV